MKQQMKKRLIINNLKEVWPVLKWYEFGTPFGTPEVFIKNKTLIVNDLEGLLVVPPVLTGGLHTYWLSVS